MWDKLMLKSILDSSKKVIVLSGAGISTMSGIKDFKTFDEELTKNDGALKREDILNIKYFKENPEEFWMNYNKYFNKGDLSNFKPNKIHKFIKDLENDKEVLVVTQNIDGLHQKEGSSNVIEVHGSYQKLKCISCSKEYNSSDFKSILKEGLIPKCKDGCGGVLKPDIVLFGEGIRGYKEILKEIKSSDLLLVFGTRLEVYPVNKIVDEFLKRKKIEARYKGGTNKRVVIWNKDRTEYDNKVSLVINEDLDKIDDIYK